MPGDEELEDVEPSTESTGSGDVDPGGEADEPYESEEWVGDDWGDEEEVEEDIAVETEAPRFVDNGNDTVSDSVNNLMWKKADSFKDFGYGITWFEALDYCEELNDKNFAGYDDWRLPSYDDAKALFSFHKTNYDKDGAELHIDSLFDEGGGDNTWTFEEKPDYHQYAMKFSFVTGNEKWEHKDNEYSHVRVVREEQKEEWEPEWRRDTKKFDG